MAEDIPLPVHDAVLPAGLRIGFRRALDQAQAGIRVHQLDAVETPLLEVLKEGALALLVLLGAFRDAENPPVAVIADADRHQQRDVAHSPALARLRTIPSR